MGQAWELSEASHRFLSEAQNVLEADNKGPIVASCLLPRSPAMLNPFHFLVALSFSSPGFTQAVTSARSIFPFFLPHYLLFLKKKQ